MKKLLSVSLFLLATMLFATSCEKEGNAVCADLPRTNAPSGLAGGWASGYTSYSRIVDAYNGKDIGPAWASGKYFQFTPNGKGAQFIYLAQSQYMYSATRAEGTIEFDEGSDAESGSFTFHACKAHYKGYGSTSVDRDATDAELKNNLTRKYYYVMEGNWLRIEPGGLPNQYTSSFRQVD